jgi:hypothetical protein
MHIMTTCNRQTYDELIRTRLCPPKGTSSMKLGLVQLVNPQHTTEDV